jgi:hypothetical protein
MEGNSKWDWDENPNDDEALKESKKEGRKKNLNRNN